MSGQVNDVIKVCLDMIISWDLTCLSKIFMKDCDHKLHVIERCMNHQLNQLKLSQSNMANMVRDKDVVHGKNANTGIFVNTPTHLVNGRAIGSTACSVK